MKTIAKMLWRRKVTVLAIVITLTIVTGGTAIAKPKLLKATLEYMNKTGFTGTVMKIVNNQGGAALELQSDDGKAPLIVKATDTDANGTPNGTPATATGLSADELDGKDSTEFVPGTTYLASQSGTGSELAPFDPTREHAVLCDSGDKVLSGGFSDIDDGTHLVASFPSTDSVWVVRWRNDASADTVSAFALCADFSPAHTS